MHIQIDELEAKRNKLSSICKAKEAATSEKTMAFKKFCEKYDEVSFKYFLLFLCIVHLLSVYLYKCTILSKFTDMAISHILSNTNKII